MQYKSIIAIGAVLAALGCVPAMAVGPYTISADGTEVTDTKTNLIWRRCAEGMGWSGSSCTGTAATYTHANALLRASSEATSSGKAWRLPNVKELASIADRSRSNPAIDITAFPATPWTKFWSSSPSAEDFRAAWLVDFGSANSGVGADGYRNNSNAVRLVRSGQ